MAGNEGLFYDEKWSEFIFTLLSTMGRDQKLRLSIKELRLVSKVSVLKRFCVKGDFSEQISLLTKVGYDWFVGVYPAGMQVYPLMKKAYSQFAINSTSAEVIQEQLEKRVFVIDNKSVAIALSIMSMNNHSQLFEINKEFLKIPATIKSFNRKKSSVTTLLGDTDLAIDFKEVEKAAAYLHDLAMQVFSLEHYLNNVWGIDKTDYQILYHLHKNKDRYVSVDYLQRQLPVCSRKSIAVRCAHLWAKKNKIEKLPKTTPVSYCIKSDGIMLLGEVANFIVNKINTY
jgi:hypothetical protein